MNVFLVIAVYISIHVSVAIGGTVERIYIGNNQAAIKGSSIQLVCDISQFSSQDIVNLYKTDSSILTGSLPGSLEQCIPSQCLTGSSGRYTFSADNSHVYIDITNLMRSEDQKYWTCVIDTQRKDIDLTIYTVPQSLQFDTPPSQDQDLAENAVTFRCSTGCASPQPSFTWFYTESGGSRKEWSTSASVTDTTEGCTDSEIIYTSTLSLARYTTFSGNVEKTVKFTCGITALTGMTQPLYTNPSINVQFAVRVTSVTLKDGNIVPSNPLQVTTGVSKTLTCTTSISRPTATIVWYIGTVEKQRSSSSTSFTFTPQNSDHNKQIFCKAFNTQPESHAVSSNKATLDVQVQVTSVTLKDGNSVPSEPLQVTAGVSKTLTCTTSASRPTATVVWYIGTVEKQRSSSSTSFTFTPQNSDHNEQIYCKAFNTHSESQAVSSHKVTLYVQVLATTPTITNQTTGSRVMLENDTVSMECISSPTRPVDTVTWKKGSDRLTNVQNTNIPQTGSTGTVSVKSTVTFTPSRNDDNKLIHCETAIPGQQNKPVSQQRVTVYWPPSTPVIPVTDLPFLEGQTGKKLSCNSAEYGNPPSEASWDRKYGTQASSNSRILNLPRLMSQMNNSPVSCQLQNSFTQAKNLQVKSPTISVAVEYTPIVTILEDGKEIQTATRNEGETFSATCRADGNPIPTVRWQGRNPASADLRFNDIDRSDHGTYTCRAEATSTKYTSHNFATLKNLPVVVNYAPDVNISLDNNEPTENTSLTITCNAFGRPDNFTVTSMTQTWKELSIQNTHLKRDRVIKIGNAQLQDSGMYTCKGNNGIPDRNHQIDQTGKLEVKIKVSPKVLLGESYTFTGKPGTSVNITVPFYSYPDIRSLKFKYSNGSEIKNSIKHDVTYTSSNVTDYFYGTKVELDGYIAVLHIRDEEESDFDNYTLVLDNGMGQPKEWILYHVSETSVRSFYIEEHLGQRYVTVDEHHSEIKFKCIVDSKSAATIKLIFDSDVLKEQIHDTPLSFIRHDIACFDAGLYICEGSNGYGRDSRYNITLFVNCSPRPFRQVQRNITSDLHIPITLSFTAIAYPEPGPKGFTWHKADGVEWMPLLSNADLRVSSAALHSNLTLMNVSKEDFGHYRVTVTNGIGTYEQKWFISENGEQHTDAANSRIKSENTALIVGVTLGVVCVVTAVYATYITILHKRKTINKGTGSTGKSSEPATYANVALTTDVAESQEYEAVQTGAEGTSDQQYTELSRYANTDKDTYDVIKKI